MLKPAKWTFDYLYDEDRISEITTKLLLFYLKKLKTDEALFNKCVHHISEGGSSCGNDYAWKSDDYWEGIFIQTSNDEKVNMSFEIFLTTTLNNLISDLESDCKIRPDWFEESLLIEIGEFFNYESDEFAWTHEPFSDPEYDEIQKYILTDALHDAIRKEISVERKIIVTDIEEMVLQSITNICFIDPHYFSWYWDTSKDEDDTEYDFFNILDGHYSYALDPNVCFDTKKFEGLAFADSFRSYIKKIVCTDTDYSINELLCSIERLGIDSEKSGFSECNLSNMRKIDLPA